VKQGQIAKVSIEGHVLKGVRADGKRFVTYAPSDPWMVSDLLRMAWWWKPSRKKAIFLMNLFISWFPMLLLIASGVLHAPDAGGGKGGAFSFGRARRACWMRTTNTVTSPTSPDATRPRRVSELVEFSA